MATIRLVPSTYAVSNSSYVTVTSPSNMYNNTDHIMVNIIILYVSII